jgi:hypothetical protein
MYPADLMAYMGAMYAEQAEERPYDVEAADRALTARGIQVDSLAVYVYPPPFMILMEPARYLPYRLFRLSWIAMSLLAVWGSVCVLALRLRLRRSLLFSTVALVFLLASSALRDCLFWGQNTCLILAALTVMLVSSYSGLAAGVAGSILFLMKVGFWPLAALLRGRRTLCALIACVLVIFILGGLFYGFDSYANWKHTITEIGGTWTMQEKNNLSIGNIVDRATTSAVMDSEERMHAEQDNEYRVRMAARIHRIRQLIHAGLALSVLAAGVIRLLSIRSSSDLPAGRTYIAALASLYLLVFIPYVWLHYSLILLIPLFYIVSTRKAVFSLIVLPLMILYALPLSDSLGIWSSMPGLRAVVPLGMLMWLLLHGDSPRHAEETRCQLSRI